MAIASITILANKMHMKRLAILGRVNLLAQVCNASANVAWWEIDKFVYDTTKSGDFLLYVQKRRYDVTPLRVSTVGGSAADRILLTGTLQQLQVSDNSEEVAKVANDGFCKKQWQPILAESAISVSGHEGVTI